MAGKGYLSHPHGGASGTRLKLLTGKQAAQRAYLENLPTLDTETLGRQWAQTAEAQLEEALTAAWAETRQAKPYANEGVTPGLFILGLGKLGGEDLNFSSDVDLVAFYDADIVPVPEMVGREYVCAQVLRTLNKLIDGSTSGAFAWRTDWRLRPDPSVTDLAMSTAAGREYFQFKAAPWRRLAMLKARVVAGDRAAGEAFLSNLHDFIWRQRVEFGMVGELAKIKSRIHLEHPALADSRRLSHDLGVQDGFHLKLGRGGIRDIEFIANALQLLWGGRYTALQTGHTQSALRALGELDLLPESAALAEAYALFRKLENAVQAEADGHVHTLAFTPWVLEVMGMDQAALEADIATHRALVAQVFDRQFADAPPPPPRQELTHIQPDMLNLSERDGEALNGILATFDQAIAAQADPDSALALTRTWLTSQPNVPAYLAALDRHPSLIAPTLASPALGHLVGQTPSIYDGILGGRGTALPDLAALKTIGQTMAAAARTFEGKLAALRTWINASLARVYMALMAGDVPLISLTELAELALDLCAEVNLDGADGPLPFTILAMGRFGVEAMAPASDLDLIFILDPAIDMEVGTGEVSRFISTMNAQLREGRVYEIDTRLRPSGASGPPTLTYASFKEHQLSRAKTWEHLALTFARPLVGQHHGNAALTAEIEALKTETLTKPRDGGQWRKDCQLMLRRLLKQRIDQPTQAPGEVKLAKGGLMELEYILAADSLNERKLDLGTALTTQRQALEAQRLSGAAWQAEHPAMAEAFAASQSKVRAATHTLLGDPDTYPSIEEHEEIAVRWA